MNPTEEEQEMLKMLAEPIPGITREDRLDAIEGESFMNLVNAVGG